MTKRQKLDYDSEGLTKNLRKSTGKGVDVFFPDRPTTSATESESQRNSKSPRPHKAKIRKSTKVQIDQLPERKAVRPAKKPSNHDTMTPRNHDTVTPSVVKSVRKAVMQVGKEAATHRFSLDEKRSIADIVYTYGRQGYRTSENEIARIAINWLVMDYQANGTKSVLEQVLRALRE